MRATSELLVLGVVICSLVAMTLSTVGGAAAAIDADGLMDVAKAAFFKCGAAYLEYPRETGPM